MLILSRKENESFFIGDDIKVTRLDGNRIGISAPEDVPILREELLEHQADDDYAVRAK